MQFVLLSDTNLAIHHHGRLQAIHYFRGPDLLNKTVFSDYISLLDELAAIINL